MKPLSFSTSAQNCLSPLSIQRAGQRRRALRRRQRLLTGLFEGLEASSQRA
jgi:hypothetical protein